MFSEVCVTASSKKKGLKLNIKKINTTCPKKRLPKKNHENSWKDQLIQGEFYSISAKKGPFRHRMEDTYSVFADLNKPYVGFGVFDGHSGIQAAEYAATNLLAKIRAFGSSYISEAFSETDLGFCKSSKTLKDGTTATIALIQNQNILIGNVGDSRAILISENSWELLSKDHIASDPDEISRIEKAGGYVIPVGRILRVQGTIAITRSIGDPGFKEYLISEPFVNSIEIGDEDLFLILSSDGLFNCLEMEGLASFCRERKDNKNLAEEITEYAISSGSRDNVTSIVVDLRCFKKKLESEPDFSSDGEETAMEIESTPKAIQKKFHF